MGLFIFFHKKPTCQHVGSVCCLGGLDYYCSKKGRPHCVIPFLKYPLLKWFSSLSVLRHQGSPQTEWDAVTVNITKIHALHIGQCCPRHPWLSVVTENETNKTPYPAWRRSPFGKSPERVAVLPLLFHPGIKWAHFWGLHLVPLLAEKIIISSGHGEMSNTQHPKNKLYLVVS